MALKSPVKYMQKAYQDVNDALENMAVSPTSWSPSPGLKRGLTISSAVLLALFVPLTIWARRNPVDVRDVEITRAIQNNHSRIVRGGADLLSDLDSPKFLSVAVFPLALFFWKIQLKLEAVILLAMNLTGEIVKSVLKNVINRPRPNPALVHKWKKADGQSFPSGNVIASLTFWGWLFSLGLIYWRNKPVRQKALLAILLLFIALDGPSRVYLGDHWTSDIIGGYLFGGGWLALWFRIYLLLRGKHVLNFSR